MFHFLTDMGHELRAQTLALYWIMIFPLTTFWLIYGIISQDGPRVTDTVKRIFLSVILVITFDYCLEIISLVADGIADSFAKMATLDDLAARLSESMTGIEAKWFSIRKTLIYAVSFISYIVALLGIYIAGVIINFVWAILYICSPLMQLMVISPKTEFVCKSLYKGILNVAIWKCLFALLAVMLVKFSEAAAGSNEDNVINVVLVNLCIAAAMLFLPFATKSLISDGLSSAGTAAAAVMTAASTGFIKVKAQNLGNRILGVPKRAGLAGAKPIANVTRPLRGSISKAPQK